MHVNDSKNSKTIDSNYNAKNNTISKENNVFNQTFQNHENDENEAENFNIENNNNNNNYNVNNYINERQNKKKMINDLIKEHMHNENKNSVEKGIVYLKNRFKRNS